MKKTTLLLLSLALLSLAPLHAAPFRVVTTTPVFQEIIQEIGGAEVSVQNICPSNQDLHFVIVKPSHIAMLAKAEIFMHGGLWGEPWRFDLVESAGNPSIFPGKRGDLNCSRDLKILDVPVNFSREQGAIHSGGNPHYWMDPVNIILIGKTTRNKLAELRPEQSALFDTHFNDFAERWKRDIRGWVERRGKVGEIRVIDYHQSWRYLYERFNLVLIEHMEPQPGIKPSGSYLAKLIKKGRQVGVNLVISEPYHPPRDVTMVLSNLGEVTHLKIHQMPGGENPKMRDIFEKFIATLETIR